MRCGRDGYSSTNTGVQPAEKSLMQDLGTQMRLGNIAIAIETSCVQAAKSKATRLANTTITSVRSASEYSATPNSKKTKYMTQQEEKSRLMCKDCKTKLRCGKCKTAYEVTYWSRMELFHHTSSRRTPLVCKTCRTQGYGPEDMETYTCQQCTGSYGYNLFSKVQLNNSKLHLRKRRVCKPCTARGEERVRLLCKALQHSKRKCTCRCPIHQIKCPLTPVIFGERRWPGSDGAITADDRRFLDELRPVPAWWNPAWGRTET